MVEVQLELHGTYSKYKGKYKSFKARRSTFWRGQPSSSKDGSVLAFTKSIKCQFNTYWLRLTPMKPTLSR